jgi:hypothetical protein
MNKNDFFDISIRGRVAFSICCFENAIKHFSYKIDEWIFIIEKLWAYTNINSFDDWHYLIAEVLPDSILENNIYNNLNFDFIDEEEFYKMANLYNKSNEIILKIIKYIFNIGISEFYGRLVNYGQKTLDNLKILIDYMTSNKITLPDLDKFMSFSYGDNDGWGNKFEGKILSTIL